MRPATRYALGVALPLLLGGVAVKLTHRLREEALDKRVALLADWAEYRDLAGRSGDSDEEAIQDLQQHGVRGVVLSALTLEELFEHHRLQPAPPSPRAPFDTADLKFSDQPLAAQAFRELRCRGVADLQIAGSNLRRSKNSFLSVKDVEIGFDPALLRILRGHGLSGVFRLNRDPAMTASDVKDLLQIGIPAADGDAVLFNSDDVPGGPEALRYWQSWMRRHGILNLLFEFHASRAAWQAAKALPANTYRAHAIPATEQKDLTPEQEMSRWRRAVSERSCRFLLVHVSPNDNKAGYLAKLAALDLKFSQAGWRMEPPRFRVYWQRASRLVQGILPYAAFLIALLTPWWALQAARSVSARSWLAAFLTMTCVTLLGACLVAALADRPETRLEITAFRGIKIAFLAGWLAPVFQLYSWRDIRHELLKSIRRLDVLIGLFVLGVVGYIMIRSGNASASWKPPMEQGLRDHLEAWLWARPRFKEFAVGHPLLLFGWFVKNRTSSRTWLQDWRPWVLFGMMGQASIVNTFCHLHSPLVMAWVRTLNGLALGMIIGVVLVTMADPLFARKEIQR